MGNTETGVTRRLRNAAAVIVLVVAAGMHPAAGMITPRETENAADPAASAADGDTLSRRNEKLLLYERSFRPSTYDAPVAMPPSPESAEAHPPASLDRAAYAAPETVQGFRIQVINTNSYDESAAVRNALLAAVDKWWVYVIFDSPTYRVRIGDFQSRLEAKQALETIQSKGFPDAMLVPDRAILHLPPRMPLPQPIDSTLTR
jgi:hypothetical protein